MTDLEQIDYEDNYEEISFSEFVKLDFTTLDENFEYNIFENNFPQCSIYRIEINYLFV